ncbi:hypothetical protein T458_20375 [Brevibacillus panacihumi W25]|uniref:Uncharacterized protein n=1 Tax=Brevibacillus panacihumi W25 TaxID=1408254 RepID=V6M5M0_9BACL|nr:hypothetical protein T458_20375 [Brevibacillus panacihumi W25]
MLQSFVESMLELLFAQPEDSRFTIWQYIYYKYVFVFIITLVIIPILIAILKRSYKPLFFILINFACFFIPYYISTWNATSGIAYRIVLYFFIISSINLVIFIFTFLEYARKSRKFKQ